MGRMLLIGQDGRVTGLEDGFVWAEVGIDLTSCSLTSLFGARELLVFGGVKVLSGEISHFCKRVVVEDDSVKLVDVKK